MKAIVVGIALCAAIAGPAAFAKSAHNHPMRQAGTTLARSRHGSTTPNKDTIGNYPAENDDVPFPGTSRQGHDSSHAIKPDLKIVTPEVSPAIHNKVSEPRNTGIRDALGQPVEPAPSHKRETLPSQSARGLQGMSLVPPRNAAPSGLRALKNTVGRADVTPRLPSRSAIGGTGMIRRNVASSIGGPAKLPGGINGTLIRSRHP